jgi:hypothetical protein
MTELLRTASLDRRSAGRSGTPKKFPNRSQKMSLFRRQAMSGPRGGNARWDKDLPASAGSPKIANLKFFSVAV